MVAVVACGGGEMVVVVLLLRHGYCRHVTVWCGGVWSLVMINKK